MKRLSLLLGFVVAFLTTYAQTTKKALELAEFHSLYVNSNYTVYLKQTNKQEVTVEALTEIFQASEFKVENGVLMINIERKPENPNKSLWAKIDDIKFNQTMKVYISVKSLKEIQVNGGGKVISENSIAAENLALAVNGSGSIDLDVKGNKIKTDITGSGTIALKGYGTSLESILSGSGNLKAFNCPFEQANVRCAGSGSGEINVTNTLTCLVLGSGSLKHKGNTASVTKKVYGSGSVDRAY